MDYRDTDRTSHCIGGSMSTVDLRGRFWTSPTVTFLAVSMQSYTRLIHDLFSNNEQGFVYDPNDLSTMYQDAAGTNPVTTTGQPVGLLLDKSNGLIRRAESWNHASARTVGESSIVSANTYRIKSTDGSPSYVYCPGVSTSKFYEVSFDIVSITGNISTDVDNAPVWASVGRKKFIGKPLGGWLTIKRSGVCDAVVANISVKEIAGNHAYQTTSASRPILQQTPMLGNELVVNGDFSNGTAGWIAELGSALSVVNDKLRVTALGINPYGVQRLYGLTVGKTYQFSYSPASYIGNGVWVIYLGNAVGGYQPQYSTIKAPNLTKGGTFTFTATTTVLNIALVGGQGTVVGDYADFDNISVRELTGYHTDQNYLEFDGSDDFLQTSNIDFTGTDKVSLFAGVRKLSDASSANLVELSISTASQNGSFHLRTPTNSGSANVDWSSRGTVRDFATSPSAYASPTSIVISTKGNISRDSAILRVNGVQVASSIGDQGTGNYGNYPLYIGRRGGTEHPFNGHIYGLIGVGKLTSDSETTIIEKEIAKRVGVTLNV